MLTFCFVLLCELPGSNTSCLTNHVEGGFLIADVDYLSVECSLKISGNWAPRLDWQLINASQTSSVVSEPCPQHHTGTLCRRRRVKRASCDGNWQM